MIRIAVIGISNARSKADIMSALVYVPLKPVITAGQRYGRLIALEPVGRRRGRKLYWRFRCDCGKMHVAGATHVRAGATQSCGCLRNERIRAALTTHGKNKTPEHRIWIGIINRCENPKNRLYHHYGARGIAVCDRWRYNFAAFLADLGPRPSLLYSVDRHPDKNGNYEPQNCRWATDKEQARNQTTNRMVNYLGRTTTLAEAAERAGLQYDTVWARLARGWTIERALSTPVL